MSRRFVNIFIILAAVLLTAASVNAQSVAIPHWTVLAPKDAKDSIDILISTGAAGAEFSEHALAAGFLVFAQAAGPDAPMAGDYEVLSDRLRFTPRFPLREGVIYAIAFDRNCFQAQISACSPKATSSSIFTIEPDEKVPLAQIAAIEPKADTLPANLLRLYIHFTGSMSQGDIYKHISLLRADGSVVQSPFLNLTFNLWNDNQSRLTVLFDPGRIKRDVGPNRQVGAPLVEGETYTLMISPGLLDAKGRMLLGQAEKKFTVDAPIHVRLDPLAWSIRPPSRGLDVALEIDTPVHIDSGGLDQAITVVSAEGDVVPGATELMDGRKAFRFVPDQAWVAGDYRMLVRTDLEDVSGNSVQSALDAFEGRAHSLNVESVSLPFSVSSDR